MTLELWDRIRRSTCFTGREHGEQAGAGARFQHDVGIQCFPAWTGRRLEG
jgi:hypothetical protein